MNTIKDINDKLYKIILSIEDAIFEIDSLKDINLNQENKTLTNDLVLLEELTKSSRDLTINLVRSINKKNI